MLLILCLNLSWKWRLWFRWKNPKNTSFIENWIWFFLIGDKVWWKWKNIYMLQFSCSLNITTTNSWGIHSVHEGHKTFTCTFHVVMHVQIIQRSCWDYFMKGLWVLFWFFFTFSYKRIFERIFLQIVIKNKHSCPNISHFLC